MLTNLEQQTLSLAKSALKKYLNDEPDWEQRRYETARDLLVHNDTDIDEAIMLADMLIDKLRNQKQ